MALMKPYLWRQKSVRCLQLHSYWKQKFSWCLQLHCFTSSSTIWKVGYLIQCQIWNDHRYLHCNSNIWRISNGKSIFFCNLFNDLFSKTNELLAHYSKRHLVLIAEACFLEQNADPQKLAGYVLYYMPAGLENIARPKDHCTHPHGRTCRERAGFSRRVFLACATDQWPLKRAITYNPLLIRNRGFLAKKLKNFLI